MSFTEEEKLLVQYFKDKLKSRGITKFPRDWHLKQLSVARYLLTGDKPPSLAEWKSCIDWAFEHQFWGDKVDHLATVERVWIEFKLKSSKHDQEQQEKEAKRKKFANIYMN